MNVAQAMARTLAERGVTDVFTLMGGGNLRMIHHLVDDEGVAVHHVRHEAAAVNAADGFARTTGRVGVCTVTHGPGFTNTITALLTAVRAHTPLVLMTTDSSDTPGSARPFATIQALRPELLLDPLQVPVVRLEPGTAAADTARALDLALRLRTPVALVSAAGHDGDVTADGSAPPVERPAAPVHPSLDQAAIGAAIERLSAAKNPMLLVGRGVVSAGAVAAVRELAAHTGATIVTTLWATGLFAGDPHDAGVAGGFSSDPTAEMMHDCDCLVVLGASLNWFTTRRGDLIQGVPVVHVDHSPTAFGKYADADLTILGDVGDVLAAMNRALVSETSDREPEPFQPDDFDDRSGPDGFDPRAVSRVLHQVLPPERAILTDAGHFAAFPVYQIPVQSPDALLFLTDFGAVGSALGAAVGAALGRPERPTVVFVGDGGLFMTLGELDLMVRDRVPLLVVCMNDQAYGSELVHLQDSGLPETEALFVTPDLAAVAAAIGCRAARITSLEQLRLLTVEWLAGGREGTLVLDVPITRSVRSPLYAHI